jgi:hypothetical protein
MHHFFSLHRCHNGTGGRKTVGFLVNATRRDLDRSIIPAGQPRPSVRPMSSASDQGGGRQHPWSGASNLLRAWEWPPCHRQ